MFKKRHLIVRALNCVLLATVIHAQTSAAMQLPADFKPQPTDFTRNAEQGSFLWFPKLTGLELVPRDGVHGIYVLTADQTDDRFRVGDVIFAVNGQNLINDTIASYRRIVRATRRDYEPTVIDLWRAGETVQVVIDNPPPQPPDLTQGGKPDLGQEDWSLGTTGAAGLIWGIPNITTKGSRQIYICEVRPGSAAEGVLQVGDVIVGAFGRKFQNDARREFAEALTLAETEAKQGRLELTVWNDGEVREAVVPLKVMGSYSDTTPADCEKTQAIIDQSVNYLLENGLGQGITQTVNALGLLSTGREDVMPAVQAHVEELKGQYPNDWTWYPSYQLILLAEYYLITGDDSVKPTMRAFADHIARGQSMVGTWGHIISQPLHFSDGTVYGRATDYGALNATGIVCMISLAMAEKCGITNRDIRFALQRGSQFFKFYMNKGAIPYGDHPPRTDEHDDNGKCSMAAVMFDLLGEEQAATFFTKMALASHQEREFGHTGNYFSFLWGPLGAARAGDEAASAFKKELLWFYDLERRPDGRFIYQGKPAIAKGRHSENCYVGWDCTGARLLAYTTHLKNLHITGKQTRIDPIKDEALAAIIEDGRTPALDYLDRSMSQLLELLKSWSPAVRERAALALGRKSDNVVDVLVERLKSDNRFEVYGAMQGLTHAGRGSEKAADAIIEYGFESKDPTAQYYALGAFSSYNLDMGMGRQALRVAPAMMKLAGELDRLYPQGPLKSRLGWALFYSGNAQEFRAIARDGAGLENVDRQLLIETVRELLQVDNGASRGAVAAIYDNLSDEELKQLWPDIYRATRELAPSGLMFASNIRLDGLKLMARHRTREGMETAAWYITNQKFHGNEGRTRDVLQLLVEDYAGHARAVIPTLEKAIDYYTTGPGNPNAKGENPQARLIREALAKIKAAPIPDWELTSIAEYLD